MTQTLPIDTISARLQAFSLQDLPAEGWTFGDGQSRLDLSVFVEAMKRVDAGMFPIGAGHIERVLQAWQGCEDLAWDGGWLFELTYGRRADITIVVEGHDWENESAIKVTVDIHPADFDYMSETIAANHPVRLYGCTDQVERLNDFLNALRREERPLAG